ncbi:MAG: DUF6624 domain-containing protein [Usitatibacteraceae bacterium]
MKNYLSPFFAIAIGTCALIATAETKTPADWSAIKVELETIYKTDQAMRQEHNANEIEARAKGQEVDTSKRAELWKRIGAQDRANQARIAEIIDQYGWPKKSDVGASGALTVFLVIQHADLPYQLKYIDRVRDAAAAGEAAKSQLALLEDRALIRQDKPQRYGSQVATKGGVGLLPTEDEANLDVRRASMGLGPICEYLGRFVKAYGKIVYPPCVKETADAN